MLQGYIIPFLLRLRACDHAASGAVEDGPARVSRHARKLPATVAAGLCEPGLFESRSCAVRLLNTRDAAAPGSDKANVRLTMPDHNAGQAMSIPWAMQMKAISIEEPSRLVQTLTGAILGCGGWVLSRGANDCGTVSMLFEFERQACVDIYSVMIAAGLELSQSGHIRFTELCQCTKSRLQECGTEIASIDLEIQTFPVEMMQGSFVQDAV
jgi:hypothetical protein